MVAQEPSARSFQSSGRSEREKASDPSRHTSICMELLATSAIVVFGIQTSRHDHDDLDRPSGGVSSPPFQLYNCTDKIHAQESSMHKKPRLPRCDFAKNQASAGRG